MNFWIFLKSDNCFFCFPSLSLSDSEIPAPRYNHATVPLDSNILLLYGGFSGGDLNNDLWALDTGSSNIIEKFV
jgi:hypothetical protein